MRDVAVTEGDKMEAQLRFGMSVNTYGVNDLVARVDAVTDADVDALVATYEAEFEVVPELLAGGERRESLRLRRPARGGVARFLDRAATSRRSPPTSRIWVGFVSCRVLRCSG